jgi:hypothetical protein
MASILVLLIILGCIAYQYLKGSLVKAFNSFIFAIISVTIALGFFEMVSNLYITRSPDIEKDMIYWSRSGAFMLIFVISYIIFEIIASSLLKIKIDLGLWPDRIGRSFFGIFQGLIIAGAILIFLGLAPLPQKYPYLRFAYTQNAANIISVVVENITEAPNLKNIKFTSKVFLNADGFAVGFASLLSSGSMGGETSFKAIHPDFINEVYLNRNLPESTQPFDLGQAVTINNKAAVWQAANNLKFENDPNSTISPTSGNTLMFVRIGFKKTVFVDFTISQIKLICKPTDKEQPITKGSAIAVYPVGFLSKEGVIKSPQSDEKISLTKDDFKEDIKGIDFLFDVPAGYSPAIIQYKLNNFFELPKAVTGDQIPSPSVSDSGSDNLEKMSKDFINLLAKDNFDKAVDTFDDTMKAALPADKLKEAWNSMCAQMGSFKKQLDIRNEKEMGFNVIYITCKFQKDSCDAKIAYNSQNQISGLFFVPTAKK